jgi:integrase/recombinase XerD
MLTIYRRHKKSCEHRSKGRDHRRCKCPMWVDGFIGHEEIRCSLGTTDWERGQRQVRDWEAAGEKPMERTADDVMTVEKACAQFKADATARNLKAKTIYKYTLLFRQLETTMHGIPMERIDVGMLTRFRATWKETNLASLNKLGRMKCFFRFCRDNGWIAENPADRLKNPRVSQAPTLPFTQDEMFALMKSLAEKIETASPSARENARRLRSLVMVLRYSGLRIGDAVSCSVERLVDGKLRLYTAKTGQHVHLPLPPHVVKELDATPRVSERFWFWSGGGQLQSAVSNWQMRLAALFKDEEGKPRVKLANGNAIEGGHAHRFRDTFAVELLLASVPIERVSMLLGHSSVRITEKHYAPWVRERQEQAEADVRRAWGRDQIVVLENAEMASGNSGGERGTPQGHGKNVPVM